MDLTMNITTTAAPAPFLPTYVGYIMCAIAVLFFGSNFIPVKKFETGDGLFFQLILCIAIWIPSIILHAIRGFPRFWPLAMLGGFLWASGNIMVVPIIQTVGLTLGILIWGTTSMLMGWASGRFGFFGLTPEPPHNATLNSVGVVLCVASVIVSALIKPHIDEPDNHSHPQVLTVDDANDERDPLLPPYSGTNQSASGTRNDGRTCSTYDSIGGSSRPVNNSKSDDADDEKYDDKHGDVNSLHHKLGPHMRRVVGITMCVISGVFYGVNFDPVIYIKDNYPATYGNCTEDPCTDKVSSKDMDYVFAHFTGILLTSILYFIIYCIIKKNQPIVYPKAILPAFASGIMWSIADISFFIANEILEESTSFPIISVGPVMIASLWGVFVFREIKGLRNLLILGGSVCLTLTGCILCGYSK